MFQGGLTTTTRREKREFNSTYDVLIQEKFGSDIAIKELAVAINNGIIGGSVQAAASGFNNR